MLKSKAEWLFSGESQIKAEQTEEDMFTRLLSARGLHTEAAIDAFLYPALSALAEPAQLSQIELAKSRILEAIAANEKIIVYGDYDADGVTSTTVMMKTLQSLGADCDFYIPNRFTEGYGMNEGAIEHLAEQHVAVIITVDNGISNVEEVALAQALGMDVIITDHHEVQEELPEAYAIIHPKLSTEYPCDFLAGVGVAFQFAHFLLDEMPNELMDLVAIGTIADLVPLIEENRVLAYHGLKQMNKTSHIGLEKLMSHCGITLPVTEQDIGFSIAPRLNSAGRLGDAALAVELLLTTDEEEATMLVEQIEAMNDERKSIVETIVQQAEKQVDPQASILMLYQEDWHEGVLGIAASRIMYQYDRPVIMLTYNQETKQLKGSARSIPQFDLFKNCMEIQHLFTNFGGHAQAAGMTFPLENFNEIKSFLSEKIQSQLTAESFKQQLEISASLTLSDMTEPLVRKVQLLAPFGMKNEEPLFLLEAKPTQVRKIGQDSRHLKLQFKNTDQIIDVVGFQFGCLADFLTVHTKVEVVGKLQINEWNGTRTVQLMMEDLAINEWQLFDFRAKQTYKNFASFLSHYDQQLIVTNQVKKMQDWLDNETIQIVSYDTDIESLSKTDILYVMDIPYDLKVLEDIVKQTEPSAVHVSYTVTEDAFLQPIPQREDFKWMYGYIAKKSPIQLKVDLPSIMSMKKWSKDRVIFILKVFLDLQFIKIEDNTIYLNKDAAKSDLQASRTYQFKLQQSEIEKTLYYSNYEELKAWFISHLTHAGGKKEEVLYEL